MLFCLSALRVCAHAAYWKGHRLWLLSHREPTCQPADMMPFERERVHVIRATASADDEKVTRGVKAAYKQACPLPDRKLRAAEALPCLICQRRRIWWWARSTPDSCFDFSLRDTSVACHIASGLSRSLARSGRGSAFRNRTHACKQAGVVLEG